MEIKKLSGVLEVIITGNMITDEEVFDALSPNRFSIFEKNGYEIKKVIRTLKHFLYKDGFGVETITAVKIDTNNGFACGITAEEHPEYYEDDWFIPNPLPAYYVDMGSKIMPVKRAVQKSKTVEINREFEYLLINAALFHNMRDSTATIKLFEDIVSDKYNCFLVNASAVNDYYDEHMSFSEAYHYVNDDWW